MNGIQVVWCGKVWISKCDEILELSVTQLRLYKKKHLSSSLAIGIRNDEE